MENYAGMMADISAVTRPNWGYGMPFAMGNCGGYGGYGGFGMGGWEGLIALIVLAGLFGNGGWGGGFGGAHCGVAHRVVRLRRERRASEDQRRATQLFVLPHRSKI